MSHIITVPALDPDSDEPYEIDTRPCAYGMYEGVVTGPLGSIAGDAFALRQLGLALLAASASADFATTLRVDEAGPLSAHEAGVPDLSEQSPAQAAAQEGWMNTVLVWATAGDAMLPVEPSDWVGDNDGTATALVDDATDLHFSDERLHARSRCRHAHIHRTTVEHPADLAAVRRRAEECTGDEDHAV
ncbi:hypothetical protein [Streptomyces sp. NPDC058084]|uniref:hypothetical protein n=1 Tax=Streptomyces sp. NPDC058084 TaxID=3346333 RepID=UPI0036EA299D